MSKSELRSGGTIGHLLLRAFHRYADAEMIVGDGERLSYSEMSVRTARMLSALNALGLESGHAVALLSRNRIDVLAASYAAYIGGIRITPLSPLTSEDDLAFMLEDGKINALIVDDTVFAAKGLAMKARLPALRHLLSLGPMQGAVDLMAAAANAEPAPLIPRASPDDVAVVGYTGGTTGKPKGVTHSHATLMASVMMMAAEWEWPEDLRLLVSTPVSHAAGVLALPAAVLGGSFHMLAGFDADAVLDYTEKEQISATFMVPVMIYRLCDAQRTKPRQVASLRTIFYGAAPMLPARLKDALEVFGPVFMQLYGQAEAPTCITWLGRNQHSLAHPQRLASCGIPFADVQVSLRDEQNREVQLGEVGEICVRGPHVMLGYWNRPSETSTALADGWLHTGDMGRFDRDGFLYIVERKKDMVISGGVNIFPKEVEDVIAALPGVAQVAVVGLKDERWGEAVVAAVVARDSQTLNTEALVAAVREKKGPMHAPKQVVVVSQLPMTPLGKIDKKALRQQLENGR